MQRWIGKLAIVTGASAGIGEAVAKSLVGAGVNVIGLARREEQLKALAGSVEGSKGKFHPMKCDVRNEVEILKAFDYAERNYGGTDILVNNAGICPVEPIAAEGNTENLRAVLDVNVLAAAICARETINSIHKRNAEGHIINMNSVLGIQATRSRIATSLYAASKYALHAMTGNLRIEILARRDKIRITGIYPGFVRTEILKAGGGDTSVYDKVTHLQSQDIADCILYVLSTPPNVQIEELTIGALHQKL